MSTDLPILLRPKEHAELLSRFLVERFESTSQTKPIRILEAGCGRKWPIDLNNTRFELIGVDSDKDALDLRRQTDDKLVDAICASLLDVDLKPASFDIIYCSYVLEHVDGAEAVLDRFRQWLKPGGVIVLKIPDRDSVYGFLARTTPFWLHVLFKRWVQKMPNAGKPGYDPFPTFYDDVVSRRGIHSYCDTTGLVLLEERGMDYYLNRTGRFEPIARFAISIMGLLSFGKLTTTHNNLLFIVERSTH